MKSSLFHSLKPLSKLTVTETSTYDNPKVLGYLTRNFSILGRFGIPFIFCLFYYSSSLTCGVHLHRSFVYSLTPLYYMTSSSSYPTLCIKSRPLSEFLLFGVSAAYIEEISESSVRLYSLSYVLSGKLNLYELSMFFGSFILSYDVGVVFVCLSRATSSLFHPVPCAGEN